MSFLLSEIDWSLISKTVSEKLAQTIILSHITPVSGGDIHQSFRVVDQASKKSFFIKLNHIEYYSLLKSESESLDAIASVGVIKTPKVFLCDTSLKYAFLLMEYLPLVPVEGQEDGYTLGQQLALLHKGSQADSDQIKYGFHSDNYIGLTLQKNNWSNDWCEFWIQQRFYPQLKLAYKNSFSSELRLLETDLLIVTNKLLATHQPESALVHGDLWAGNKGYLSDSNPVIFDPACYFGDRETDIAMTELFGGFSKNFYLGYEDIWPLPDGYKQRKKLYNLYHMLNHLNLFGDSYLPQVKQLFIHFYLSIYENFF